MANKLILALVWCIVINAYLMLFGTCQAVDISIDPDVIIDGLPMDVNITCTLPDATNQIVDVLFIEVIKLEDDKEKAIAILKSPSVVSYGTPRMEKAVAKGTIGKDVNNTILTLTIENPSDAEAGEYACKVFFVAADGTVKTEMRFGNLTVDNDSTDAVIKYLLREVTALKTKMESPTKANHINYNNNTHTANNESRAAFSATANDEQYIGNSDTVKFDDVIVNEGNGYNNTSGIFTAMDPGLYFFALTLNVGYGFLTKFQLMVNQKPIATLWAADANYASQSALNTVVKLQPEDQVYVRATSIVTYKVGRNQKYVVLAKHDKYPSSCVFSGYLIQEE